MRKILTIILCLLLCAGAVGGAFALYKHFNPNDKPAIDNPIENPDDNTETPSEPVDENVLTVPDNESDLVEPKMVMQKGAQAYLGTDESYGNALRFALIVDNSLIEEVEANENLSLAMMIAPLKYFDRVNTENYTYVDWFTIFTEMQAPVELVELANFTLDENQTTINMTLRNIPYGGINMDIVAMGVLVDNSGETPVYTYSEMPEGETYRSNARSLAYVAGATLNAVALGETSYDESTMAKLEGFVNMSVDLSNGLSEPTDDLSKPSITFTNGNSISLKTNATQTIEYTVSPANAPMPIRFVSIDTSIATVSADGVITGINAGTTTIKVCIAGVVNNITVTVSNN